VEHIIVLFADTLLAIDRFLQQRLRNAVVDFDELWTDPAGRLAREEVVIGPLRRYAVATALGTFAGLLLPCGLVFQSLDQPHARPGPPALAEQVLLVAGVCVPPLLGIGLFWHWLRGGEMVLRRDGVVLRFRSNLVFCPWELFQADGDPWPLDRSRLALPVWPPAVADVVHGRGDAIQATGRQVRTRPLYFRADHQVVLRDLYAVRLTDLGPLLLHLGRNLGATRPAAPFVQGQGRSAV
jgi:hypothetical protein